MAPKVAGLTGGTLETAPSVCHECVWWQSGGLRNVDKRRWIQKAEEEWGAWGTVYYDADGRLLGSMQYGPSGLFPRAARLPAGPPSPEAVLVTCAYVVDSATPWVMQSLFLAGDRGREGPRCEGAGGVRVSVCRGRVDLRTLPRPPDRVPVGLPRRLRVPHLAGARDGWSWRGSSSAG